MKRAEIEAQVTESILKALEDGTVPWEKPWTASGMLPTSLSSGKAYRGINVWLLTLQAQEKGYGSPYWATYKQAQEYGGNVRKGEKSTLVVFWKPLKVKDETAEDGFKTIPLLRYFRVFNAEQCEGLELPPRFKVEREPVEVPTAVSDVLEGYKGGPRVVHALQDSAYYRPDMDTIHLPLVEQFKDGRALAGTTFHELVHSTGHASRLNRFARNGEPSHFGSELYAREELVAEMGAALLGATVGLELETERNAAYIASWLKVLQDDHGLVITAAAQAHKAVDRITGATLSDSEGVRAA